MIVFLLSFGMFGLIKDLNRSVLLLLPPKISPLGMKYSLITVDGIGLERSHQNLRLELFSCSKKRCLSAYSGFISFQQWNTSTTKQKRSKSRQITKKIFS
jgi:hypothetical protein